MKKTILLLLPALLLCSCLNRSITELDPSLIPDQEEIFAVADAFSGDGVMTKVVRITSNRSWSAHLNDLDNPINEKDPAQKVPWATLSTEDHPNITGTTEETDLTITFNRNHSKTPVNGVLNIYSEGQLRKSVKLTQGGVIYALSVSSDQQGEISDAGMLIPIKVSTNAPWTARVADESTADAVFLTNEGVDSQEAVLRVRSNDDPVTKTLKVVFSAPECEDQVLSFVQSPISPDAKVMEVPFKFAEYQQKKAYLLPLLTVADDQLDLDVKFAGVKYYYTYSRKSFDDCADPTTESPLFPTAGLNCQVGRSSVLRSDTLFVKVLCVCSDQAYRDSYYKLYVRTFQFGGTTYPEYLPASGTVSGIFPAKFEDIEFSSSPETNPGWSTRLRMPKNYSLTYVAKTGTRGAFFGAGYSGSQATHKVNIDGAVSEYVRLGASNQFLSIISPSEALPKGKSIVFTVGSENYWAMQHVAFLEQLKYKP